jgi:hypothetical protein
MAKLIRVKLGHNLLECTTVPVLYVIPPVPDMCYRKLSTLTRFQLCGREMFTRMRAKNKDDLWF